MAKKTTDYEKLKQPYQITNFTQEQLKEFVGCAKDPLYFMNTFMYIQHGSLGRLKFKAFEFQKELINSYWKHRNTIAMIPRQSGKTTTAAGFLLWYAMFNPDVTILIAAHKFKAASEIMVKIKYAYEELPNHIRPGVVEYNVQSIKFDNNSRILANTTTPDSGRGMAISLLYLDEFAYVKKNIAEEFWSGMSPTLATGGKCIITSTPFSDEDMFAYLWKGAENKIGEDGNELPDGVGKNGFHEYSAHYSQVPGRDEAWAAAEKAKIGEDKFKREYECVSATTHIKLQDTDGNIIDTTIEEFYKNFCS